VHVLLILNNLSYALLIETIEWLVERRPQGRYGEHVVWGVGAESGVGHYKRSQAKMWQIMAFCLLVVQ